MSAPSRRPYLIRAMYEWAIDSGYTPHLVVAADEPGVEVPRQYVQDGRITLNISPQAVQSLDLTVDPIWFSARFSGRACDVFVPARAVLAIVARENGEGMIFGEPEPAPDLPSGAPEPDRPAPQPAKPSGRPKLRLVK